MFSFKLSVPLSVQRNAVNGYNIRSRGDGLTLSVIPSEFMRKNFINRMLFNDDIDVL